MAEVYTTNERPRDTVVVEKDYDHDHHDTHRLSTGAIVAIVLVALIVLFLLFGLPSGGGGGTPSVNVPAPTAGQ